MNLAADGSAITFSTSMTPSFTSAQFGSGSAYSTLNSTGLTLPNGAAFATSGIQAGGMTISGLARGAVNSSSSEAVTGAQLYEALTNLGTDITTSIADVTYTKVTGFTINDGIISMTTEEAHLNTPTNTTHGLMKLAVTTDTTASSSGTSGTVSLMDTGSEEAPVTDTIRNVAGDNITITSGEGTIVTAMTRNGRDFGIRVAGTGKQWFTAPVNTPVGLFFTGYTQDDANPDIGDSAITETYGVGGASMVAAPGVTRFVGAGGFQDALRISDEMQEIYADSNPMLLIPGWDFQGSPMGLDIRRVVETGITPLINTGIAHKKAGIGQVGAGTVRAPLDCFVKAFEAAAEKLGIDA